MTPEPIRVTVPGTTLLEAIGRPPEGVEVHVWDLEGAPPVAGRLDVVVPPYMGGTEYFPSLRGIDVGLIQSQSIGFDGVAEILPPGQLFANAATVHEASTAELTLGLILAAQRGIPQAVRSGDAGRWEPRRSASLADRRVLMIGAGGVGRAIAARLAPFEVELTTVARTARGEGAERVHALSELPALLPDAEILILAVPLDPATEGLADAAMLAALPDGALVVNIARGPVMDTDAAVAELGRLRFALDVTDPEPLPAGHPLWGREDVLITPHVGGASTAMMPRMAALVRRQAEHALRGENFENIVLGATP